MAILTGIAGSLTGANYSANIFRWEMDVTADELDTTVLGDTAMDRIAGVKRWTGSFQAYIDGGATGPLVSHLGVDDASVVFGLQSASGATTTITGTIKITDYSIEHRIDGLATLTASFDGQGAPVDAYT